LIFFQGDDLENRTPLASYFPSTLFFSLYFLIDGSLWHAPGPFDHVVGSPIFFFHTFPIIFFLDFPWRDSLFRFFLPLSFFPLRMISHLNVWHPKNPWCPRLGRSSLFFFFYFPVVPLYLLTTTGSLSCVLGGFPMLDSSISPL